MYAVREVEDGNLDPLEHGLLVPLPGPERDSIVLEGRDGDEIRTFTGKRVAMRTNGERKPLLQVEDVRARIYLTDARLAFACSKYEKGGGWWGFGWGALFALLFNAMSKARAAVKRKGKMLVGQVRYPWISEVHAQGYKFMSRSQTIRLIVKIPGEESWTRIDLTLPKEVPAPAIASEIIRRAARFRLAHEEDLESAESERLRELASIDDLVWEKGGQMVGRKFPSSWPVSEKSALLGAGERTADGALATDAGVDLRSPPPVAELHDDPAGLAEPAGFCPDCGTESETDDLFCGGCGARLDPLGIRAGSS